MPVLHEQHRGNVPQMSRRKSPAHAAAALLMLAAAATAQTGDPTVHMVPCQQADTVIYQQQNSRYRLVSSSALFTLINAANQKVLQTQTEGDRTTVLVTAGDQSYAAEGDPQDNLYDTPYLQLASPEIKAAALSISREGDLVFNIETYVRQIIHSPMIGIPIIPAPDILKNG